MKTFNAAEFRDHFEEIFDLAESVPVLIGNGAEPTHVLLSADAYRTLYDRLEELETQVLGNAASDALSTGQMAGSEKFIEELRKLRRW